MVCVRQLEDMLVLQTLLLVPPSQGAAGSAAAQCSIKTLLEGGTGRLLSYWLVYCFIINFHSPLSVLLFSLRVFEGGIADSVSKWVFRHNLAPEQLKEMLQKREDKDDKLEQRAGEEGKEEKEKSQEDADRKAGEDLRNIQLKKRSVEHRLSC